MSDSRESDKERAPRIAANVTQAGDTLDTDPDLPLGEDVTLELDADLIAWFRENEDDQGTAINAALREHMDRQRGTS